MRFLFYSSLVFVALLPRLHVSAHLPQQVRNILELEGTEEVPTPDKKVTFSDVRPQDLAHIRGLLSLYQSYGFSLLRNLHLSDLSVLGNCFSLTTNAMSQVVNRLMKSMFGRATQTGFQKWCSYFVDFGLSKLNNTKEAMIFRQIKGYGDDKLDMVATAYADLITLHNKVIDELRKLKDEERKDITRKWNDISKQQDKQETRQSKMGAEWAEHLRNYNQLQDSFRFLMTSISFKLLVQLVYNAADFETIGGKANQQWLEQIPIKLPLLDRWSDIDDWNGLIAAQSAAGDKLRLLKDMDFNSDPQFESPVKKVA